MASLSRTMATRQPTNALDVPPGSILLVIHDFIARSPDELSLAKGDRIELIERDDDFGDGWFLGRHMTNGSTGLFPEVYTTPAPKGTLTAAHNPRALRPQGAAQASAGAAPEAGQAADASKRPASEDTIAKYAAQAAGLADIRARHSAADAAAQRPLQSTTTPLLQTALRTSLPAPGQRPPSQIGSELHSTVINETLSVIDEHITDMHAPSQAYLRTGQGPLHDTDSIYSSGAGPRLSYINGHETDEEEHPMHTEAEVTSWSPDRVAGYLEDNGVERAHCNVFREQEISGEVLLAMEQSALFIKEFELGSVGRRLKTWQKVKALQDETRTNAAPSVARSVSDYGEDAAGDAARQRGSSINSSMPQASNPMGSSALPHRTAMDRRSNTMQTPPSAGMTSPMQTMTSTMTSFSPRPDNSVRPSAASIRNMNHSRRHSSIDSQGPLADMHAQVPLAHRKQPSFDRDWTPNGPQMNTGNRSSFTPGHTYSLSGSQYDGVPLHTSGAIPSPVDVDKGYFSGNEADGRSRRTMLQRNTYTSPIMHSRNASNLSDADQPNSRFSTHGRVLRGGADTDAVAPDELPAKTNGIRSVSSPQPSKPLKAIQSPTSPIVTKLDYGQSPSLAAAASPGFLPGGTPSPRPSPSHAFSFFGKPRLPGLRVTSDAVTQGEKNEASAPSALKEVVTGSNTPSTEAQSFDLQKPDAQSSRASAGSSNGVEPAAPIAQAKKPRTTKKATSAYTRGLEKKGPSAQMLGCDYSGWMKKKSSNLMGTWKPRLFVLRGRRLSYYYSETDTEEKGLIDISSHRVLPAENEKITGLHAQLTGASSTVVPTSPQNGDVRTAAAADLKNNPAKYPITDAGLFIFKLVPPRQGLSKAVNFTKPTVHYFAVNSRQEGRLWMAALMKATIDYDSSGKVVTSYNQNTISLIKARARKERPPALQDGGQAQTEGVGIAALPEAGQETGDAVHGRQGLGIDGLPGTASEAVGTPGSDAVAGAERRGFGGPEAEIDANMLASATNPGGISPALPTG